MVNFKEEMSRFCPEDRRIELASMKDCPEWLLKTFIEHDISSKVIRAALNNQNCPPELKKNANASKIYASKTFCPIPWNHLMLQQTGDYRICCMSIYEPFGILKKEDGTTANVKNTTMDEARNLPMIKELRKSMINGEKHNLCKQCWDVEDNGLTSKRQIMLRKYNDIDFSATNKDGSIDTEQYKLRYLDLRFGNLCNLHCRSCGPMDSSLWLDNYHAIHNLESESTVKFYYNTYKIQKVNNKTELVNENVFQWYEKEDFWIDLKSHCENLDRIYFTGGEPSVNKTHFKLLNYLIDNDLCKNITLEYNTNMVAIPDKLYEMWQKFKKVEIGCSIDGINEMAYYIRPPAKWDTIEKNLDKLDEIASESKNITAAISATISIYNVHHYLDMIKWLLSKNYKNFMRLPKFHMLEGPLYMNTQVLPYDKKIWIENEYNKFLNEINIKKHLKYDLHQTFSGIIKHMKNKDLSRQLPYLKVNTEKMDKFKNQSLQEYIPWLYEILKDIKT